MGSGKGGVAMARQAACIVIPVRVPTVRAASLHGQLSTCRGYSTGHVTVARKLSKPSSQIQTTSSAPSHLQVLVFQNGENLVSRAAQHVVGLVPEQRLDGVQQRLIRVPRLPCERLVKPRRVQVQHAGANSRRLPLPRQRSVDVFPSVAPAAHRAVPASATTPYGFIKGFMHHGWTGATHQACTTVSDPLTSLSLLRSFIRTPSRNVHMLGSTKVSRTNVKLFAARQTGGYPGAAGRLWGMVAYARLRP